MYDLFFKKEKLPEGQEDKNEFSLAHINVEVTNIDMEQVEEMTMTSGMEADESDIFSDEIPEDGDLDLESIKRKFEEENNLHSDETKNDEKPSDEENTGGQKVENPINKKEILEASRKRFKDFMSLAETSVQMIKTADGEKLFKSTMNFNPK
ncbi:MAG: hypothetical protein Q4G08_09775 [Capnocytophaga sp.]|nr:hypothetical protein [Capnocytophaga sp.]